MILPVIISIDASRGRVLGRRLQRLPFNYSVRRTYSQATPRVATERVELWEQKFDYTLLYLLGLEGQFSVTEDAVVYLVRYLLDPRNEIFSRRKFCLDVAGSQSRRQS